MDGSYKFRLVVSLIHIDIKQNILRNFIFDFIINGLNIDSLSDENFLYFSSIRSWTNKKNPSFIISREWERNIYFIHVFQRSKSHIRIYSRLFEIIHRTVMISLLSDCIFIICSFEIQIWQKDFQSKTSLENSGFDFKLLVVLIWLSKKTWFQNREHQVKDGEWTIIHQQRSRTETSMEFEWRSLIFQTNSIDWVS